MIFNWRRKKKKKNADGVELSTSGNRIEWAISNPIMWKKLSEQSIKKNKKK